MSVRAPTRLIRIVAAALAIGAAACSKDQGQASADGGAPSQGATCGVGGQTAVAQLEPLAAPTTASSADAATPGPITGTATFAATASGVDLKISITGCADPDAYPVVIHEGPGCSTAALQGPAWDPPRGAGIGPLTCTGNSGSGLLYYSRADSDPNPWSVGAPSSSDVVGRVLVIHDPSTMMPLACGAIVSVAGDSDATGAPPSDAPVVPVVVRAEVAGLCVLRAIAPAGAQCPDPQSLSDCACTHCDLAACLTQCSDYATCLAGQADAACTGTCPVAPTCAECMSNMSQCLLGFCPDVVECAALTPGGPCTELEACCATQNGALATQCLETAIAIEKAGGDTSCVGAMHDGDFLTHDAYDPPCNFDDAGARDAATDAD